jgi:hypothetical protein
VAGLHPPPGRTGETEDPKMAKLLADMQSTVASIIETRLKTQEQPLFVSNLNRSMKEVLDASSWGVTFLR